MVVNATHAFLRKLRATARAIQSGTPPDFAGLNQSLAFWRSSMPVAGGRIQNLLRSAQTDLKHHSPDAALGHLSTAIEMVERVQKQVVRKHRNEKREPPAGSNFRTAGPDTQHTN